MKLFVTYDAENFVLVPGTLPDCIEAHVPGTVIGVVEGEEQTRYTVRTYNGCVSRT